MFGFSPVSTDFNIIRYGSGPLMLSQLFAQFTPQDNDRRLEGPVLWILLGGVIVVAFILRVWGMWDLVYANPDDGLFAYFIVNTAKLSMFAADPAGNALARILSWDPGWPLYILYHFWVLLLDGLHIPITEMTLQLPLIFLGVGMCFAAYRVTTDVHSQRAGVIAAGLVAVMLLPVSISRSLGTHHAYSSLLLLLTAAAMIRYMRDPQDDRNALWVGVLAGLYICGDLQFHIGLAVLFLLGALWPKEPEYRNPGGFRRLFFRSRVLLPPLIMFLPYVPIWIYAQSLGYPHQTFLGTILVGHEYDWGFHIIPTLADMRRNMGLIGTVLAIISTPILLLWWRDNRCKWLLGWIGVTAAPFLLAVTSEVTQASVYHEHLLVGLVAAIAVMIAHIRPRWLMWGVFGLVMAVTGIGTAGKIFPAVLEVPLLTQPGVVYGELPENSGLKTVGYWVRENVPEHQSVYITAAPGVAYWYLGRRPAYAAYVTTAEMRQYLRENATDFDVIIIRPSMRQWAEATLPPLEYEKQAQVTSSGDLKQLIYARQIYEPMENLYTETYDERYEATYNSLDTILPEVGPYVPGKPLKMGAEPD
ncbi:MAG: hypothetical protein ACLFWB_00600 [Armatimonadota bacterium]